MKKFLLTAFIVLIGLASQYTHGQSFAYDQVLNFETAVSPSASGTIAPYGDFFFKRCVMQSGYNPAVNAATDPSTKSLQFQVGVNRPLFVLPVMTEGVNTIKYRYRHNSTNAPGAGTRTVSVFRNYDTLGTAVKTFVTPGYSTQYLANAWPEATITLNDASTTDFYTLVVTGGNLWIDNLVISKNVANPPTITTSPLNIALAPQSDENTPSASQSFTVSGTNLSAGVDVTPPLYAEISTDNVNFQTGTINIASDGNGGLVANQIFVRSNITAGFGLAGPIALVSGSTSSSIPVTGGIPMNFYFKGNGGALNDINNWGLTTSGNGRQPTAFNINNATFNLIDNGGVTDYPAITSAWILGNNATTTTKLVLGNNATGPLTLNFGPSGSLTNAKIVFQGNHTLKVNDGTLPVLETNTNTPDGGSYQYFPNLVFTATNTPTNNQINVGNLTIEAGEANVKNIRAFNSVTINDGAILNPVAGGNKVLLEAGASVNIQGTLKTRKAETGSLISVNEPTLTGNTTAENGGTLQFVNGTPNVTIGTNSTITYARVGTQNIQDISQYGLSYNVLRATGNIRSLTTNISAERIETVNNGKFQLGDYDLTANSISIGSPARDNSVITNGSGSLILSASNGQTKTFPVTTSSDPNEFTPIEITHAGTANQYKVRVANGSACAGADNFVNKNWNVTPVNAFDPSTDTAKLEMKWLIANTGIYPGFDINLAAAVHCDGDNNADKRGSIKPVATDGDFYTMDIYKVQSFSPFAVTSNTVVLNNAAPLAVNLEKFSAKVAGQGVKLSWSTVNESETSHFEIQKSLDGTSYKNISTIAASSVAKIGNGKNYSFIDNSELSTNNYYRLKMVELNGKVSFSKTEVINGDSFFKISPNPSQDFVSVTTAKDFAVKSVKVLDAAGNVIMNVNTGFNKINISKLPKNSYILEITSKDNRKLTRRVIKN